MFIRNFQGTYECPSTAETLKTIKKKHDESLRDYVKYFCNVRNVIPYIQDIDIINAFYDGVSDIKNVEEIAMKKHRTVADLLTVANICIKASEARARLLKSCGKGPVKKKQDDREVKTTDQGDHKDRGDRRYRQQQSSDQKEKRPFRCPDDAEKWCEIHRTSGHDVKECKTFLDCKKTPPPTAQVAQEPRQAEHRRANPANDDEQMGEINVIFRGSMSLASNTQGKKLEREMSLAQRIEPGRMMRCSGIDISFELENHPDTELPDRNLLFVVKLPIMRHKVAKILIDNGKSLNLITRKTFIKMGINLKHLTTYMIRFRGSSQGSCPLPSNASTWRCLVE
jgi:hypothetical protein